MISRIPAKVWRTLLFTVLAWLLAEGALQVRAHLRYGTSIANVASAETTFVFNETFQIKTLRPGAVIKGSQSTIETNALGLRSPEVAAEKRPEEFRVVVLGASTVMGTYTRNNADTLSYRLEAHLKDRLPDRSVTVINAGIAGAAVNDQARMLERLVIPHLKPDLLVWYPGFNDVSAYCRKTASAATPTARPAIFQALELPTWLLSVELLTKNTVWLRTARAGNTQAVDARALDLSAFEHEVEALLTRARSEGIKTLVLTNARAFRRTMPLAEQEALSETARYYNACFDLQGLHDAFDLHNQALVKVATKVGVETYRFDEAMPGGKEHFGDATHFSIAGTDLAASDVSRVILERKLLSPEGSAQ